MDDKTQNAMQELTEEVKETLQFFIDEDMKNHGEVKEGTLETLAAQGYGYSDGKLEMLPETAEQPPTAPKIKYYPINEEMARISKQANSFYDYKAGSATAEYQQSVDKAYEIAEQQKQRVEPQYHEKIDRLVDTYARKLAQNRNNYYSIEARVPSILISGAGNFPTAKKHKQNAARDRNMGEWRDIQGYLHKIQSTGTGGISADDPNAIERLQAKLEGLKEFQELMKSVNAYYRKHKTLDGCPNLKAEVIESLKESMARSWRSDPKPFEAYSLTNNNADIRRVAERIEELKRKNETTYADWDFDGGRVEVNKQENRLQIFFDEKPDEDTRKVLKSKAFKWSPKAGAWQRQLTSNAFWAVEDMKFIHPLTGETPRELQRKAQAETPPPVHQTEQPAQKEKSSITERIEKSRTAEKTAPENPAPVKANKKDEPDL